MFYYISIHIYPQYYFPKIQISYFYAWGIMQNDNNFCEMKKFMDAFYAINSYGIFILDDIHLVNSM